MSVKAPSSGTTFLRQSSLYIARATAARPGPSCARSTFRGRLPGHSPGRTRGARNRPAEEVFRDAHAHWCEIEASSGRRKGEIALELLFRERPGDYCRLVASILPKEFTNNAVQLDLADDELDELIAAAASRE